MLLLLLLSLPRVGVLWRAVERLKGALPPLPPLLNISPLDSFGNCIYGCVRTKDKVNNKKDRKCTVKRILESSVCGVLRVLCGGARPDLGKTSCLISILPSRHYLETKKPSQPLQKSTKERLCVQLGRIRKMLTRSSEQSPAETFATLSTAPAEISLVALDSLYTVCVQRNKRLPRLKKKVSLHRSMAFH